MFLKPFQFYELFTVSLFSFKFKSILGIKKFSVKRFDEKCCTKCAFNKITFFLSKHFFSIPNFSRGGGTGKQEHGQCTINGDEFKNYFSKKVHKLLYELYIFRENPSSPSLNSKIFIF